MPHLEQAAALARPSLHLVLGHSVLVLVLMLGLASHEPEGTWGGPWLLAELEQAHFRLRFARTGWIACGFIKMNCTPVAKWGPWLRISSILLQPWCGGVCWEPAPRRYPRPSDEVFPQCGVIFGQALSNQRF